MWILYLLEPIPEGFLVNVCGQDVAQQDLKHLERDLPDQILVPNTVMEQLGQPLRFHHPQNQYPRRSSGQGFKSMLSKLKEFKSKINT